MPCPRIPNCPSAYVSQQHLQKVGVVKDAETERVRQRKDDQCYLKTGLK